MKSILFSILVLTFTLASCQSKKPEGGFLLKGKIDGADGKTYVVATFDGKQLIGLDTATVENGTVEFSGVLDYPQQVYIIEEGQMRPVMQIFAENTDMSFEGSVDSLYAAEVKGSKSQDLITAYNKDMEKYQKQSQELGQKYQAAKAAGDEKTAEDIYNQYMEMNDKRLAETEAFIAANPASPVSLFLVQSVFMREDFDKLNNAFSKLDTTLSVIPGYKEIQDYIDVVGKTQIGKTAPDFTVPTIDGKEITLSSLKGKYVLLDFWASWCKPCIGEIPYMQKAYQNYKDKGFEILSVSVDRDENAWKKAVADNNMTWLQGHDTEDISHSLYGVMSIPTTLLLDKDGVIIAKNLRGTALEDKLKELMK
ncbi:MAG: AhpC/TSA family protein [Chlorobi bacterium]|nr:AhpC/TSA family protein [Chlorobiota bacterium]